MYPQRIFMTFLPLKDSHVVSKAEIFVWIPSDFPTIFLYRRIYIFYCYMGPHIDLDTVDGQSQLIGAIHNPTISYKLIASMTVNNTECRSRTNYHIEHTPRRNCDILEPA